MVKSPDCLEYKCAWYKNSRCAIINIAEQLEEAQRNILKTALNKPDK